MSRIYWDSMLFIYWIEYHPSYGAKMDSIFEKMKTRGDDLCTSILTIGEVLVQPLQQNRLDIQGIIEDVFASDVVTVLPIDRSVVELFAHIRAANKIASADALHLACAGAHGCDVFLTNDKSLHRLKIPGIKRIADLTYA